MSCAGEKRRTREQNQRGLHYTERSYGRFERRICLDEEVDTGKIEAKFRNGVLTITLTKNQRAPENGGRIEITS